jgi:hypothetical protein
MGINLAGSMDGRLERASESRRDGRLEGASEARRGTLRGGGRGYAMMSGECSGEENRMKSIGGEDGEERGKREDREGGMGWRDGMKTSSRECEDDNKRGYEKRMTTATSSGSLDQTLIGTSYLREKNVYITGYTE